MRADILLISTIFPGAYVAWKDTTQHAKCPDELNVKPSNKAYIFCAFQWPNMIKWSDSGVITVDKENFAVKYYYAIKHPVDGISVLEVMKSGV